MSAIAGPAGLLRTVLPAAARTHAFVSSSLCLPLAAATRRLDSFVSPRRRQDAQSMFRRNRTTATNRSSRRKWGPRRLHSIRAGPPGFPLEFTPDFARGRECAEHTLGGPHRDGDATSRAHATSERRPDRVKRNPPTLRHSPGERSWATQPALPACVSPALSAGLPCPKPASADMTADMPETT